ncbi:IucA/IucC family protein, partial [Streptomyces sp. B1866]|uniref:IucA/IucC family protein n=1 Tax=Streptomyces sp. B1866 TaxID=3075431 RepID=UPI00288FFB2E
PGPGSVPAAPAGVPAAPGNNSRGAGQAPAPARETAAPGADPAPPGTVVTGLDAVLARIALAVAPEDRDRYAAFVTECRRALAATRLHARVRPAVVARLAETYGPRPAEQWTGLARSLAYDTLAAFRDHPVHPTSRARSELTPAEQRGHAPEFHPEFPLRWAALPREAVTGDPARLPPWWPAPGDLGLPALDGSHLALPVHPLTAGRALPAALRAAGLDGRARLAERPWLAVRPTLSMRTVGVVGDPAVHLKLPLPTATLGLLNRRTVQPGTLVDGEVAQRLVAAVTDREPRFADAVLLADETTHLHAGSAVLAALVRRYPDGLADASVVPLAALLAPGPDGTPVADALADRYYGGDLTAFLDAYLALLFDFHATLFGYGIALESHQQNTSLVLDRPGGRTRLRLLLKDHDGPRVHAVRLAARIGGGPAADLCGFADRRILTGGDGPVADVFATITVHLCAAAPVLELAALGRAPRAVLLAQVRDRLGEAVERLAKEPGAAAAVLRARVLDADRLPVKAMVTAGTLFPKERTGAADINKYYVTGPNYLRPVRA